MALSVFQNVIIMLVYMSFGFALCKTKLGTPSHARTLSGLLIYILGPAMIINAFMNTPFSVSTLLEIGIFFLTTLIIQSLFFALLILVFHKKYSDGKYRIMTMASVLGNVGFFGLPLITGIFPNEPIVACYSSIHVMSMNLLVFTVGKYLITNDKKYISLRGAIFNPTTIAILISLPLFILQIKIPDFAGAPLSLLAKMVTPICMIILGMRLSACKLGEVFKRPFAYATCALKLVAFPLFALLLVNWLPFLGNVEKTTVVVLAMMPSGAIIESMAELHECEQEFAANVVLLTTILSVITIPVMTYLLV